MVNILLSGCNGRMGQVITKLCKENSDKFRVVAGIDKNMSISNDYPVFEDFSGFNGSADVVVDFSNSALFPKLLDYCVNRKFPLVLCTTGLSDEQLAQMNEATKVIPILRSGNMSLGINLMIQLLKTCAGVLGDSFDVEVIEKHHNTKVDAPSGTSLMLADAVAASEPYTAKYVYDRHTERHVREKNEIGIHTIRGGTIVGEHEVIFAGKDEVIEIKHSVQSRNVFAVGALNAAEYLANISKPALYSMSDVIRARG